MKCFKGFIIVVLMLLFNSVFISSQTDKPKENFFGWDTNKFHLGFGVMATTGNLLGLIESIKMNEAAVNRVTYDYPGLTTVQKEAVKNLSSGMVRAMCLANILGAMEYSFRTRIMYSILISDIDVVFLPLDGSYNGRLDLQIVPTIGVRLPWFVMPYITVGPAFTFSFYPDRVANLENWKINAGYGVYENFAFRPGLNTKIGVDLNLRKVMVGVFYQYEVKDFNEFTDYYNAIVYEGFSVADAIGKILGYQSRFGVSVVINLM